MWDNPRQMNVLSKAMVLFLVGYVLVSLWGYVKQRADWFPVKAVLLNDGLKNVTRKQVELVVRSIHGANFFAVDLGRLHQAFDELPWVDEVIIRRDWRKRMIKVSIVEHQPFAKWGDYAMMSQQGKVFNAVMSTDMPVLFGPQNTEKIVFEEYKALKSVLEKAELEIAELTMSDRFSWRLLTKNGMTVEIGSSPNVIAQVQRFVEVFRQTAGEWRDQIDYVDLRYRDGFAVKRPQQIEQSRPKVL